MKKNSLFTLIFAAFISIGLTANTNAQVVVFSNDFEDGDLDAEIGSMDLVVDSAVPAIVPVTGGVDTTLGNNVALLDFNPTTPTSLDLTLSFTDTLSLANGNTVSLDFDVAARRTNGIAKVIHVDAMDSNGNIVVRFVLGDNNAFRNEGGDRQRPGYATSADGRLAFGNPPGSFWWGADTTPDEFDPIRDAHISLTIGESSFDFSSTRQDGNSFDVTGVSNYDTVTSANIAEIKITSPLTGFGMYFDNLKAEGVVDSGLLLGDCDQNGTVNFLDISPFIVILTAGDFLAEADCNEDGVVNFLDISTFIAILNGN